MPRLFLIRHAEPRDAWGGAAADPGLSDAGLAQAESAAAALALEGPLGIVSSPMRRCRETAAAFARLSGAAARIEPRVSEVASPPGVHDRRAWLAANFPWAESAAPRRWPSLDRALYLWRQDVLDALHALQCDTAIFSHFIAINAIIGAAMRDERTIVCRPDCASITTLALDHGGLRVLRLGAQVRESKVL
jgi:broad specificity phosphatase PhoE